jgi:hypothetical protein
MILFLVVLPESEDIEQGGFFAQEILGVVWKRVVLDEVFRDKWLKQSVKNHLFFDKF